MPENTREITLEEAKKLYNSNEEAKTFLLSKFTKDELEGKNIPSQEEFNKFFEENILSQIEYSKTKFLDCNNGKISKIPTSRIELKNSNNEWLFDYNYDPENPHFYYSYDRVYNILNKHLSCEVYYSNKRMKSFVENQFNLHDVPLCNIKTI